MNQDSQKRPTDGMRAEMLHPGRRKRKNKNQKKLQLLGRVMIVVVALILVIGILLLTLPMFKVKTIEVEGNSGKNYTDMEIIKASGIEVGDHVISVMFSGVDEEKFYGKDGCEKIRTVEVSCSFSTVTITVTE